MEKTDEQSGFAIGQVLDTVWHAVVFGDSSWRPDKSCQALYEEYRVSGNTVEACVENLIQWQMAKTAATGFVLSLPGAVALPITIPADLASTLYVQLRMVVVIGMLHGWDPKSDRLRILAYLSLLGSTAGESLREAGVKVGTKVSADLIKKIPGEVIKKINQFVGFRLVTKAGEKGVINLMKLVPIFGGIAGGGLNAFTTRQIGNAAAQLMSGGPCAADEFDGAVDAEFSPAT